MSPPFFRLRHLFASILCCAAAAAAPATAQVVWEPYRSTPVIGTSSPTQAPLPVCPPTSSCGPSTMITASDAPFQMIPSWEGSLPAMANDVAGGPYPDAGSHLWHLRVLPEGVIWRSYLAGVREPRTSGVVFADRHGKPFLDVALGGRMAVLRYGTGAPLQPQGWEVQIEGAATPRLNLDQDWDMEAVDFRFGVPLVYGRDQLQWKFAYYHVSAHLGDELAIREDRLDERIPYVRDSIVIGLSYFPLPAWRWYAETGFAFYLDGGAQPWEFQFGVDIVAPGPTGMEGTPFVAFNGHLREEIDYGGNLAVQAGWLWRGTSGRMMRTGVHYFNGKSSQYEFFNTFEQQIGAGLWAEF